MPKMETLLAEPWRVWKARDMASLINEIRSFVWLREQNVHLFTELHEEVEALVKLVARKMDSFERRKFYCAKRIWHERNERLPSAEKSGDKRTWAEWFEQMYDEPLERFAERAKAESYRERIKNFELATYGFSPLADGPQQHLPDSAKVA